MGRLTIAMLSIVATAAFAAEDPFAGKRVVRVFEEPRHRVVHQEGDLYLMDVQIRAGDTTLPHTHDSAIIYTFIHQPGGPADGETRSITSYAEKPFTHEVANDGPGMLHIIALSNYGKGQVGGRGSDSALGEPQLENRWFRSYRVSLNLGEETAPIVGPNPSVVVQVTGGTAHVTQSDGLTEELARPGSWAWRNAGSEFRIRNAGTEPVELVINEARTLGSE